LIYFSTDINRLYNLVFVGQDIVLQRFAVWDRSIEGSDEPDRGFETMESLFGHLGCDQRCN